MEPILTDVGLDVHKDTFAAAAAAAGKRGEAREYGKIAHTPTALRTLAAKLSHGGGTALRFCCAAGPCGYGLQRQLTAAGHDCVVAPSRIARKPGDRIKTDRRDAINLARLRRAGDLTPV